MRPTISYEDNGRDAYVEGSSSDSNPYEEGSFRHAQWKHGFLKTAANDPLAFEAKDDPLEISEFDIAEEAATAAYRRLQRFFGKAEALKPTVADLERFAGPSSTWPANCHGISSALLQSGLLAPLEEVFGKANVLYGCYDGWISRKSIFAGRQNTARHGWIEFEDGLVIDPTLWVFHAGEPEISVSSVDDYDFAHRRLRARAGLDGETGPVFDETQRVIVFDGNDPEILEAMHSLLGETSRLRSDRLISFGQALWLGKQPVEKLGDALPGIYGFLCRNGLKATIPIDHRILSGFQEEEPEEPSSGPRL